MTKLELTELQEEKTKNRFKSRTFWLVIIWVTMLPVSIIAQLFVKGVIFPIDVIANFAGLSTLIYIGGNKGVNIAEIMKLDKNQEGPM